MKILYVFSLGYPRPSILSLPYAHVVSPAQTLPAPLPPSAIPSHVF